jgi:hypothetical protein
MAKILQEHVCSTAQIQPTFRFLIKHLPMMAQEEASKTVLREHLVTTQQENATQHHNNAPTVGVTITITVVSIYAQVLHHGILLVTAL